MSRRVWALCGAGLRIPVWKLSPGWLGCRPGPCRYCAMTQSEQGRPRRRCHGRWKQPVRRRVGRSESRSLGVSESRSELQLATFVGSREWKAVGRVVRAVARRFGARRWHADIVQEAELRVLQYIAKGKSARSWTAFAGRVARSVVRWWRRQELPGVASVDALLAREARTGFDELTTRPAETGGLLRGATQQKIVAAVSEGLDCATIAAQLGQDLYDVRRQVAELAALVRRRRAAEFF